MKLNQDVWLDFFIQISLLRQFQGFSIYLSFGRFWISEFGPIFQTEMKLSVDSVFSTTRYSMLVKENSEINEYTILSI